MIINRKGYRKAAFLLAGFLAAGSLGLGVRLDVRASTGISSLLPAAGMALTMEEGSSSKSVKSSADANREVASSDGAGSAVVGTKDTKKAASDKQSDEKPAQETAHTDDEHSGNVKPDFQEFFTFTGTDADTEPDAGSTASQTEALMDAIMSNSERPERQAELEAQAQIQAEADLKEREAEAVNDPATEEEKAFEKLVIAKVTNYVNIRSTPNEEGEVVGKLYDKSVGEFIEEENGWYKITSGSVTGYVKGEFCVTGHDAVALAREVGTRVAVVNTTTLKVRNEASTESAVLGLVPIEEELTVVEELEGWVKVDIEEGYGYVSKEFVNLHTEFVKAESIAEEKARLEREERARKEAEEATRRAQQKEKSSSEKKSSSSSSSKKNSSSNIVPATSAAGSTMGQKVVNFAMQFVGNPYVYGGTSLTNGADCSGFVMSVYKNFGVSLPHSSSADRSQGYDVGGLSNAQPGDLVCYSGHVGIYAGGGKIVHASTAKTGITVSNANYRQVLAVRRIFQ